MDKFDRKYGDGTALRALGANSRQDAMVIFLILYSDAPFICDSSSHWGEQVYLTLFYDELQAKL